MVDSNYLVCRVENRYSYAHAPDDSTVRLSCTERVKNPMISAEYGV